MPKPVCVVVGAGKGLGSAIARKFASEGFAVAVMARHGGFLDMLVERIVEDGGDALAVPCDVTSHQAVVDAFHMVRRQLGDPAVLIYNAFRNDPAMALRDAPPEALLSSQKVNTFGALWCAQQVIPAMAEAGRGTLLFTTGSVILKPVPNHALLGMGKAALYAMANTLAGEVSGLGLHVASVVIHGAIQPQTPFDPDLIAQAYWELHGEQAGSFRTELHFKGVPG
ncbi:MAG: SDR family NAD(P)-dependent oxidoreductase [Sphingobium sp.]